MKNFQLIYLPIIAVIVVAVCLFAWFYVNIPRMQEVAEIMNEEEWCIVKVANLGEELNWVETSPGEYEYEVIMTTSGKMFVSAPCDQ